MKLLLDACVLYPTVMREVLIGCAREGGLYVPLWSPRILEEWARAAAKLGGPEQEVFARGEIAMLNATFPTASVLPREGDLARLWLPDQNDIHVLAAAIAGGGADVLVTMNNADFPRHTLAEEGLRRETPDGGVLRDLYDTHPLIIRQVVDRVRGEAERLSGQDWPLRKLMRKARLPRLGKALSLEDNS